jgi:hypothetical protein
MNTQHPPPYIVKGGYENLLIESPNPNRGISPMQNIFFSKFCRFLHIANSPAALNNNMPLNQSIFGNFRKEDGTGRITIVNKQESNKEPSSAEPEGYDPVNEHDDDLDGSKAKADVKAYETWLGSKAEHDDNFERADKTDEDIEEEKKLEAEEDVKDAEKEDTEDEQDNSQNGLSPSLKAKEPVDWADDDNDETGPGVSPPNKTDDGTEPEPIHQPGEELPTLIPKMPGESDETPGPGDDPGNDAIH